MGSRGRKGKRRESARPQAGEPKAKYEAVWPTVGAAPNWLRILLPLLVAGAAFVTFLPALDADFVNWDDDKLFLTNSHYRGLSWSHLEWMFTTTKMGHWQPLSWVTLGVNYKLYGMETRGYHLSNILLHAGCALTFYFLALRLLTLSIGPRNQLSGAHLRIAAAAAALFFAVHPLRVESVAWVTERRDLLSGLFFIMTTAAYLKSRTVERQRLLWYLAAVAVFILSVLSKAWGMTIPAILIVLDFYPLRRLRGRVRDWFARPALLIWLEKVPFVVIAALTAWKAINAQAGQLITVKSLAEHSLVCRAAQVGYGAAFYVWKTLLPLDLIPLYELPYRMNPWEPRFVLGAGAVVLAAGVLLALRRRWTAGLALAVCYLAIYSPVSGIAQSGPQLVKDSYSYLCCLSWAVLVGGLSIWCFRRWGAGAFAGAGCALALWIGVLGLLSWRQTGIWHDSKTLWTHTLSIDDNCAMAHNNLAVLLRKEDKFEDASRHYRRSLEIKPDDAHTNYNLGNCLKALGQYPEAIECYKNAIDFYKTATENRTEHYQAHLNLANTYRTLKRIPEAVEHHMVAARYRRDAELYELVARELRTVGRLQEAEKYFRKALQKKPGFFDAHYGLGKLLLQRGECPGALEHLRKAVKLEPDSEKAQRGLARAQAQCPG